MPLSVTCLCGSAHWHAMLHGVLWCRRCGCVRLSTEKHWRVPLERAAELSSTVVLVDGDTEPPTDPGTPEAKKANLD